MKVLRHMVPACAAVLFTLACSDDEAPPGAATSVGTATGAGGAASGAGGAASSGSGAAGGTTGGMVDDAAIAALRAAAPETVTQVFDLGVGGKERHDFLVDADFTSYAFIVGSNWLYQRVDGQNVSFVDPPSGTTFGRGLLSTASGVRAVAATGTGSGQSLLFPVGGGAAATTAIDVVPAESEHLAEASLFGIYGRDDEGNPVLATYTDGPEGFVQSAQQAVAAPTTMVETDHDGDRIFTVGSDLSNAVYAFDFGSTSPVWSAAPTYSASASEATEPMSVRVGADGNVHVAFRYRDTSVTPEHRSCLIASYDRDGTSLGEVHLLDQNPAFGGLETICMEATSDAAGRLYVVGYLDTGIVATTSDDGYQLFAARLAATGEVEWLQVIDDEVYVNANETYREAEPGEGRVFIGPQGLLYFSGTARFPGGAIRFFVADDA